LRLLEIENLEQILFLNEVLLLILVNEKFHYQVQILFHNYNIRMSVYNIISDSDITSEVSKCLRNRVLDQKFLYD
jgi:hypothetical protein